MRRTIIQQRLMSNTMPIVGFCCNRLICKQNSESYSENNPKNNSKTIYQRVFLTLLIVLISACSTVSSIRSESESKGSSKIYNYDLDRVVNYARDAIIDSGLRIEETNKRDDGGARFIARKEMSLFGYGNLIRVIIKPTINSATQVSIYSQNVLATDLFSFRNFSGDIYARIDTKIASASVNRKKVTSVSPKSSPQSQPHSKSRSLQPSKPTATKLRKDYGNYYALVIGNNNYKYLKNLKTAKADAQGVARVLKNQYNFKVRLMLDATRKDIIKGLSSYKKTLKQNDNVLIYYAGHGVLDESSNEGYWLPVDATKDDELNWVSNSSITTSIRGMRAKHVMVIADSCYSGTLIRSIKIPKRESDYLYRLASKKARVVLSSGGVEPVSDGGGQRGHSVFAWTLINILKDNNSVITGHDIYSKIRRPVIVNAEQTPEFSDIRMAGHDGGDFLFVKK